MQATFFVAEREEAIGVRSIDDLPVEPAGESLRLANVSGLRALLSAITGEERKLEPLRDATCQSFPIFELKREISRALLDLEADAVDALAERWHGDPRNRELDADLFELSNLLEEIRAALRAAPSTGHHLFVLVEETAL